MARRKRVSKVYEQASTRLAGIKSINQALDLGSGLTIDNYQQAIKALQESLEAYNTVLSQVDEKQIELRKNEAALRDVHERMLNGVAAKYGKNSSEYAQAGGKRKSERKKPGRKTAVREV
jgi:predicted  nucleic acid-binding Zn-ribbon protein